VGSADHRGMISLVPENVTASGTAEAADRYNE
jgi:hypothetical protein